MSSLTHGYFARTHWYFARGLSTLNPFGVAGTFCYSTSVSLTIGLGLFTLEVGHDAHGTLPYGGSGPCKVLIRSCPVTGRCRYSGSFVLEERPGFDFVERRLGDVACLEVLRRLAWGVRP